MAEAHLVLAYLHLLWRLNSMWRHGEIYGDLSTIFFSLTLKPVSSPFCCPTVYLMNVILEIGVLFAEKLPALHCSGEYTGKLEVLQHVLRTYHGRKMSLGWNGTRSSIRLIQICEKYINAWELNICQYIVIVFYYYYCVQRYHRPNLRN